MSILDEPKIKAIILDVLKPRTSSLPIFATFLAEVEGVKEVDVGLVEMNERTDSLTVVIKGPAIDYDSLKEQLGKHGAVIHSVDQITVEKDVE